MVRGLEFRTREGAARRKSIKMQGLDAVLHEQLRQLLAKVPAQAPAEESEALVIVDDDAKAEEADSADEAATVEARQPAVKSESDETSTPADVPAVPAAEIGPDAGAEPVAEAAPEPEPEDESLSDTLSDFGASLAA